MRDPLGYGAPLPLEARYYPAGFPLTIRTNSPDILAAAAQSWDEFQPLFQAPPIELRVLVEGESSAPLESPVFRAQGHLLAFVLSPENFAVCDLDRAFCSAWLTPAVAADPLYVSFHFLDAMAYVCLTHRDLTPIHAACVAKDGHGILLAGDSGAGKSSLAFACARAGFAYVADDASWLLRNGHPPEILGKPQRLRFRPDIFEILPELGSLPRQETVAGKRSFEIRTADIPGFATVPRCLPWRIVFLARQPDGPAALRPLDFPEARRRLEDLHFLWEPSVAAEHGASLDRLDGCEAYELRYSTLAGAVDCLWSLS